MVIRCVGHTDRSGDWANPRRESPLKGGVWSLAVHASIAVTRTHSLESGRPHFESLRNVHADLQRFVKELDWGVVAPDKPTHLLPYPA